MTSITRDQRDPVLKEGKVIFGLRKIPFLGSDHESCSSTSRSSLMEAKDFIVANVVRVNPPDDPHLASIALRPRGFL